MKNLFSLAILSSLLCSCTTSDDGKTKLVTVAPVEFVQRCSLKGNIYSESPYFGIFTETTQDKLEELAKESALRLGANTVVLNHPQEKDGKYTLEGKAYLCP
ncbi:MAG: DUF4156 domain-containing protein [Pseudobdellovibrionaceae bacterium]